MLQVSVWSVVAELPSLEHSVWPEMEEVDRQFEMRTSITVSDNAASRYLCHYTFD